MTVTNIKPVSVSIQGVRATTVVGTANLVTAVTDGSDSTYITATVDKQYIRYNLGDISALASNQRVKSVKINIRNARDGSTNGTTQDTRTEVNNCTASHLGTCAPVGSYLSTRGLTNAVTIAGPYAYAAPCGKGWDQGQVNNLCILVWWFKAHYGSTSAFQKVYELSVDVDVNTQPLISGTPGVTNFTNNATPTISWLFTDADDDLQAAWRVKVFDAATIAAANFNPDTSKPVWDSQVVYTQDAQVTVPVPLLNGVSYTAYVQAAQAWPGPQGKYWWSLWTTSAPFTVTFVPPPTPVIQSANVVTDVNQYGSVLTIFAPINLLTADNASFETTIGNWAALTNMAAPVRDTAQFADGAASMKLTSSAAGDMVAALPADANKQPQVQPGEQVTIVANFRANTVARACNIGVQWVDNAGANIGGIVYGGNVTDSTANFNAQATLTTNAPGGAYQGLLRAKVQATGAAGEIHWVDKVSIMAGSSTTWGPGGYTNDQGDLLLERGEYILGDRGPSENWFHPQVASCGSMFRSHEYGFNGNPASSADTLSWRWLDKPLGAPDGETPPGMLDYVPGTTSVPYLRFGEWFNPSTAFMVPVVQGQTHIFSVWGWTDTGTCPVNAVIDWRDINGQIISSTNGSIVTLTTTPQRLVVTGTPPGTAFLAAGAVINSGAVQAGVRWRFTRAGFGLGTVPVDGKLPRGAPTGLLTTGLPAGLVWTPVRFRDDGELMGVQAFTNYPPARRSGQVQILSDYEYAPGRPTLYRASIAYSSAGNVIRSAYAYVCVYGAPPAVTMLRSVTDPTLQMAIARSKEMTISFADDAAVAHPLGIDGGPVRVRDWVGGEDGQISVYTSTSAQSQRLRRLIMSDDVMLLQWPQGGHTYCLITDRSIDETLTADVDICDIDGVIQPYLKHHAVALTYIETVAP